MASRTHENRAWDQRQGMPSFQRHSPMTYFPHPKWATVRSRIKTNIMDKMWLWKPGLGANVTDKVGAR